MNGVTLGAAAARVGRYRWWICALLFFASAINYVDRQVVGILKPTLQQEFGWSEVDYGYIVMSFQIAYAIGLVSAGRLIDRIGTRRGFAIAVFVWSVAAMAHAGVLVYGPAVAAILGAGGFVVSSSVAGFIAARFALGLGEAANFPAGIKAIAEWFPRRERAFAAGLFNAGTNVGALTAPLAVPWLTLSFGWPWAFLVTGAIGFIWLAFWWRSYRLPATHPRVGAAELALIHSDAEATETRVPWAAVLPHRQTLAFAAGKFITDPVWWVYLFWIPDFLNRNHGLDLSSLGPPLVTIFLAADAGSIAGGWCSSFLIARGWSVNRARKTTMLLCALAVTPIFLAAQTTNLWAAVAVISLAAAAHQGWSSNLYTLTSDMFPRQAVGSVVGLGGMAGAVAGIFVSAIVARILEFTGSYIAIFAIASVAYLIALAVIHALVPRLEPARV
jgi:ACS family hexuronate transporter-like MFS transporter